jgi:hypothetical protein
MAGYWKGKKLSRLHVKRMNISRWGFFRTPAQRLQASRERDRKHTRKVKERLCEIYGKRCANSNCKWRNEDGSFGCTDIRILQLDHKQAGGLQSRKKFSGFLSGGRAYYLQAIRKPNKKKYQMLCPNCNWIKRIENKEFSNVTS